MARVIVILGLMIAITATMFWITRKPPVATEAAATPASPSATVSLAELNSSKTPGPDEDIADKPDETHSQVSVEPRLVTNPVDAAQPGPASAQDVTKGPVAGAAPSIATAGVDHKSNASFTGTATPGDAVSLVWDEKPVSWTTADPQGNWMLEFKAPAPDSKKEHELYVTAQGKDGSVILGPQRAFIGPPATPGGLARITLKAADQSTKTLQDGSTTAGEPATGIIVEKIIAGSAGDTLLSGKADSGATVKVQINGKAAGETVVGADGAWLLTANNASGKAAKSVRLELVGKNGAKLDEAEVPYDVPAPEAKVASSEPKTAKDTSAVLSTKPIAEGAAAAASAGASALFEAPSNTVEAEKPKLRVVRVKRGDSLWRISKRHLGNGKKWAKFYRLNKRKIDNPDLIYPGQTLVLPG